MHKTCLKPQLIKFATCYLVTAKCLRCLRQLRKNEAQETKYFSKYSTCYVNCIAYEEAIKQSI